MNTEDEERFEAPIKVEFVPLIVVISENSICFWSIPFEPISQMVAESDGS